MNVHFDYLVSFRLFDLDGDGLISHAEMLCIVDAMYRMIGTTKGFPEDELDPKSRVDKVFRLMDLVFVSNQG